MKKKGIILTLVGAAAIATSSFVWAGTNDQVGTITIYSQPNTSSKVVEKINGNETLINIFIDKDWTKVGDPSNGTTGWVENARIQAKANAANTSTTNQTTQVTETGNGVKSVTKGVVQTQYGPMNYEITQFQDKVNPKSKEAKAFMDNMQKMQLDMNNAFAKSWNGDFNKMQANMIQMMNQQQQEIMKMQKEMNASTQPASSTTTPAKK